MQYELLIKMCTLKLVVTILGCRLDVGKMEAGFGRFHFGESYMSGLFIFFVNVKVTNDIVCLKLLAYTSCG